MTTSLVLVFLLGFVLGWLSCSALIRWGILLLKRDEGLVMKLTRPKK